MRRAQERPPPHPRRLERGTTAVFLALSIAFIAAFLALALDVGHGMAVRTELQTAADSAALAGAQELALHTSRRRGTVTSFGQSLARVSAGDFSAANTSDGASIQLDQSAEVSFGQFQGGTFTPTANLAVVNAIRVVAARANGSPNSPLSFFLSNLLSSLLGPGTAPSTVDVGATSIAMVGGRCDLGCPILPLVIQNCTATPACNGTAFAGASGNGNASWTDFGSGVALANIVTGNWACPQVQVGDCINVTPPVTNADLQAVQNVYAPPAAQRFVVPVICPGTGACGGGAAQVLGFMTVTLNRVVMIGPPPSQGVSMITSCGVDNQTLGESLQSGQCTNYGALFARPRLVQ